jgi:hypothetical protein
VAEVKWLVIFSPFILGIAAFVLGFVTSAPKRVKSP